MPLDGVRPTRPPVHPRMPKQTRRKSTGRKARKPGSKDPLLTVRRLEAQKELIEAKLDRLKAAEEEEAVSNRVLHHACAVRILTADTRLSCVLEAGSSLPQDVLQDVPWTRQLWPS